MSTADEICFRSASDLAAQIRSGEVSPVEVVDVMCARIDELNPELVAFCALDHERARAEARRAESAVVRGEQLGPLHGVPISVKDLLFTADLPTVGGSKAYLGFQPGEDDVAVQRVRRAGAIVLGKTNVPDFGYGPTSDPVFGTSRNPWDPTRTPAGSSGGSAVAVASGMGPISLGSDGGGSIRVPASFCGIYGLNPSFGRVPLYPGTRETRYPGFSGWESLERIGPMTRTVQDAALVLDVIAGPDPRDRHSLPRTGEVFRDGLEIDLTGIRIGWTTDWGGYARTDPDVRNGIERAARQFEELGAIVNNASPQLQDPAETFETLAALDADLTAMRAVLERYPQGKVPPRLASMAARQRSFLGASDAIAARKDVYNAFWRFFERYDVLLTPTAPVVAHSLEVDGPVQIDGAPVSNAMPLAQFTMPISLAGNPAASIPCGWTSDGLPIGLQIVGNHLDDRLVLQASRAFELAQPWAQRRPSLGR